MTDVNRRVKALARVLANNWQLPAETRAAIQALRNVWAQEDGERLESDTKLPEGMPEDK